MAVVCDGEPHVLTLSDRLRPPGSGFGVGWAHLYPSTLPHATLPAIAKTALRQSERSGCTTGSRFRNCSRRKDDVLVVEVAARIPAGQMADLVRLGTGVDLVQIALGQALGKPIDDELRPKFERPLAIRFVTADPGVLPTGRVESIIGLDDVRASPGVLEADLYLQLGETINPVQVDADRRGYIITTAADPQTALELADQAARELEVIVRPRGSRTRIRERRSRAFHVRRPTISSLWGRPASLHFSPVPLRFHCS